MRREKMLIRSAMTALVLSALFVLGASAASIGRGTVTAGPLRLRAEPTTSSSILATAPSNADVVVLGEASDNWYKVEFNTISGYMFGDHLKVEEATGDKAIYAYVDTGASLLNLRSGPGTGYPVLAQLCGGATAPVTELSDNGWYKVSCNGKTGYISCDYALLVTDKDAVPAPPAASSQGQKIADLAQTFLGCKYVYGGNGPNSFDCSGFTKYVYRQFGYTLNRTATDQLKNGSSVSKQDLQPGDLVFFKYRTSKPVSHVGIYIGGGKFIHASTNNYRVTIDSLSSGHYANVYVYGRRIV